jgi:hypothetical protein
MRFLLESEKYWGQKPEAQMSYKGTFPDVIIAVGHDQTAVLVQGLIGEKDKDGNIDESFLDVFDVNVDSVNLPTEQGIYRCKVAFYFYPGDMEMDPDWNVTIIEASRLTLPAGGDR